MSYQSSSIPFSKWKSKWEEEWENEGSVRREDKDNEFVTDMRCGENKVNICQEEVRIHEENVKWEVEIVSNSLNDVRKRKFFAINASMIFFPGLIGAMVAIASSGLSDKAGAGYFWVAVVCISMFIGMANMITIKYIAAFKSQANLAIRQINCLRQAIDSITYFRFMGKFPIHRKNLMEGSVYYKVFGKHRKLPIGNEGYRSRFIGSYSESADKSLIGFLFFTSTILISSPFIYLMSVASSKWQVLSPHHIDFLSEKSVAVIVTIIFLLCCVFSFIFAHWKSFKCLRTEDGIGENPKENDLYREDLFRYGAIDIFPVALLFLPAAYWFYLGYHSSSSTHNAILLMLSIVSVMMIYVCVSKVFFDSLNRIHKSLITKSSFSFKIKKSPNK